MAAKNQKEKSEPEVEQKDYKAVTSCIFGHRVVTANSVEPFTEAEAKILLRRGVIKEIEGKK